jgi:hypothetical protein
MDCTSELLCVCTTLCPQSQWSKMKNSAMFVKSVTQEVNASKYIGLYIVCVHLDVNAYMDDDVCMSSFELHTCRWLYTTVQCTGIPHWLIRSDCTFWQQLHPKSPPSALSLPLACAWLWWTSNLLSIKFHSSSHTYFFSHILGHFGMSCWVESGLFQISLRSLLFGRWGRAWSSPSVIYRLPGMSRLV